MHINLRFSVKKDHYFFTLLDIGPFRSWLQKRVRAVSGQEMKSFRLKEENYFFPAKYIMQVPQKFVMSITSLTGYLLNQV